MEKTLVYKKKRMEKNYGPELVPGAKKLSVGNEGRHGQHRSASPSSLPHSLAQYFQCSTQLWLLRRLTPLPVPVTLPHYVLYGVLNHWHLHQLPRVRRAIRWLPLCCVFHRAPTHLPQSLPLPHPLCCSSSPPRPLSTPPSVETELRNPRRPGQGSPSYKLKSELMFDVSFS